MTLLHGFPNDAIEIRSERDGSRIVAGRFNYGSTAVLSDGGRRGRPLKERIAPGAFRFAVEDPERDVPLLVGHAMGKPLASKRSGTLSLRDSDDALTFEARITPAVADTSHGRDALALLAAGLATGLSPGFRIPPERAVPDAVTVEDEGSNPERGEHNALIQTVHQAILMELSIVTKGAYPDAQVEARNWNEDRRYNIEALTGQRWVNALGRFM